VQRCKLLSGSRGSESNKAQVGKNGRQAPAGTFGAVSSRRSQRPDDMDVHTQSSSYCLGGDEIREQQVPVSLGISSSEARANYRVVYLPCGCIDNSNRDAYMVKI